MKRKINKQLDDLEEDLHSILLKLECIYRILDRWERHREDKKSEE